MLCRILKFYCVYGYDTTVNSITEVKMKKIVLKSISTESFAKFGFWSGIIFGALGVVFKIIFPQSEIKTGIPFFSYSASGNFGSLLLFFVISVIFITFDFVLVAFFVNIILKLIKGVNFYIDDK